MLLLVPGLLLASSCASHYGLAGVERSRILIDARYDAQPDEEAARFIAPYRQAVDSMMGPVMGRAAHDMAVHRPESDLSNLVSDILLESSEQFGEHPDFAVYNMGGIRAALSEGDVTVGDILDMAPFENKICFLTLTGEKVTELFRQIASVGGEGVSRGVRMTITRDGRLLSAEVKGKPIDPKAAYRIVTLDYVAQGNDRMEVFHSKTDVVSPQEEDNNVRHFIEKYFQKRMRAGQSVDSRVEGRIVVAE